MIRELLKDLFLIVVAISLFLFFNSCTKQSRRIEVPTERTFTLVYDKCEYIHFINRGVAHKGNCKNCNGRK